MIKKQVNKNVIVQRLVGGLTSENVRWAQSVKEFREQEKKLTGNVLIITGE